ncbi:glycerol-3-phosphate dehydrogenase [Stutzerimonas kirkiae]|uniref:glycerol-3-phosphate dehydrogenase n=1 Tax=Stutzerimonas kirkiae TaxID=2211392 RepID=UPI0010385C87|nr:glycerol-3-phosphate dehydrogenase [Stutzerimonas kirkiae]TBV09240.1 glycerol-3-phosphate dehydrogenase [Stutzerimonas kirkiae]TBV12219.1 glycerol-3-phosphate dehydrogenase [Stutzerimonas kirkiae]
MENQAHISEIYDLAVIGGGINGTGIAAEATSRGLSTYLCERDDLANHTSSASSKLIHGGLRYLEHGEWRLVREALSERETLMRKAPHLVRSQRFILPHRPHLRSAWLIRLGLFLYDHLGKRQRLAPSSHLRFDGQGPLQADITQGFEYSDCTVDDSRLVILNAMAAREQGAHIHPRTHCLSAHRSRGLWHLHLERADGSRYSVRASALVNAAGPWAMEVITDRLGQDSRHSLRLVQGSHLIVPRLHEGQQAYILQHEDRRIVFAIPYQGDFTLIGTTDRDYRQDPADVHISDDEIDYLLGISNSYFKRQLQREDILHSFSGVRPLLADDQGPAANVTRDYHLQLDTDAQGHAPLLSVFGGKLTTYRMLAINTLESLRPWYTGLPESDSASTPLPGGDLSDPRALVEEMLDRYAWLPRCLATRWAWSYGSRAWRLLEGSHDLAGLGEHLGNGLYTREVEYLIEQEWAMTAEDILWRRSKLGLHSPALQANLHGYLRQRMDHRQLMPASK